MGWSRLHHRRRNDHHTSRPEARQVFGFAAISAHGAFR
jgi:hypothetical protein